MRASGRQGPTASHRAGLIAVFAIAILAVAVLTVAFAVTTATRRVTTAANVVPVGLSAGSLLRVSAAAPPTEPASPRGGLNKNDKVRIVGFVLFAFGLWLFVRTVRRQRRTRRLDARGPARPAPRLSRPGSAQSVHDPKEPDVGHGIWRP